MNTLSLFLALVLLLFITACSKISEKELADLLSPNDIVVREAIQKISKHKHFPVGPIDRLFDRNIEKKAISILLELLSDGRGSEDIQMIILKTSVS